MVFSKYMYLFPSWSYQTGIFKFVLCVCLSCVILSFLHEHPIWPQNDARILKISISSMLAAILLLGEIPLPMVLKYVKENGSFYPWWSTYAFIRHRHIYFINMSTNHQNNQNVIKSAVVPWHDTALHLLAFTYTCSIGSTHMYSLYRIHLPILWLNHHHYSKHLPYQSV